jgi:hypothetical protein
MTKLDLSGEGKASDDEIQNAADVIFTVLRTFDSPKDAGSTIALAHYELMVAVFPPGYKKEASAALDAHCDLIKKFINEEWQ